MATIIEKTKDGKIVSFKFRACLGRDENKKQIYQCITWHQKPNTSFTYDRLNMLWDRYPQYHEMSVFSSLEQLLEEHES